jgi:peptide methionine sulfoxide reductase MsrA
MAEEYHQDYAIKNPIEMEKELIESGRINKKD